VGVNPRFGRGTYLGGLRLGPSYRSPIPFDVALGMRLPLNSRVLVWLVVPPPLGMGLTLVSTRGILAPFPLGMEFVAQIAPLPQSPHPCRAGHEVAAQFEDFDRMGFHGPPAGHGLIMN
jgi:hypothetical protein